MGSYYKGGDASLEEKKDSKDEKMQELLRKVDADFLAMIKEAEEAEEGKRDEDGQNDEFADDLDEETKE